MGLAISTQRGVPFDPSAAVALREKQRERQEREQQRAERAHLLANATLEELEQISPMRAEARKRDQIEAAWRERARDRRRS